MALLAAPRGRSFRGAKHSPPVVLLRATPRSMPGPSPGAISRWRLPQSVFQIHLQASLWLGRPHRRHAGRLRRGLRVPGAAGHLRTASGSDRRHYKFRGRDRGRAAPRRHQDRCRIFRFAGRTDHSQRLPDRRGAPRDFLGSDKAGARRLQQGRGTLTMRQTSLVWWRKATQFRSLSSAEAQTKSTN